VTILFAEVVFSAYSVSITQPTFNGAATYITVDSAKTALQNGACIYRCISKQMHYETPFSHNGYMKILEYYKTTSLLFSLEKTNFLTVLY
jgi:hypothetical protein